MGNERGEIRVVRSRGLGFPYSYVVEPMKVQARKGCDHTSDPEVIPEAAKGNNQKRSVERLQRGLIVIHI